MTKGMEYTTPNDVEVMIEAALAARDKGLDARINAAIDHALALNDKQLPARILEQKERGKSESG